MKDKINRRYMRNMCRMLCGIICYVGIITLFFACEEPGSNVTLPTISNVTASDITVSGATITAEVANGTKLFWVLYSDNTTVPANAATLIAHAALPVASADTIQANSGASGVNITGGRVTIPITELTKNRAYDFYAVVRNSDGNATLSDKFDLMTAATTSVPAVERGFPTPLAESDRITTCNAAAGASATAQYAITFTGNWSAARSGGRLPDNAHFTVLTGTTHNNRYAMWRVGHTASNGVEQLAEAGNNIPLKDEISRAGADTDVLVEIADPGIMGSRSTVKTFNKTHILLSLESMVAPTADWFVGLSDYCLMDSSGNWKSDETIMLRIYDAGTATDTPVFTFGNQVENPLKDISIFPGNDEAGFRVSDSGSQYIGSIRLQKQNTAVERGFPTPLAESDRITTCNAAAGASATAQYTITFTGNWSTARSGGRLPLPGSAHFTTLTGTTHNNRYAMWRVGHTASHGVEQLAEAGANAALKAEISRAGADTDVLVEIGGLGATGSRSTTRTFNKTHTLLSLESMIAPTADWFVGLSDYCLVDSSGNWKSDETIMLRVYDAGTATDSPLFRLGNPAENPLKDISIFPGNDDAGFRESESGSQYIGSIRLQKREQMTTTTCSAAESTSATAQYRITFTGNWSTARSGGRLPLPGSAHFTTLTGTTHNNSYTMWRVGSKASLGVERLAETGGNSTLKAEISAAGANTDVLVEIGNPGVMGSRSTTRTFNKTHTLISLESMIAPTADWFVGLSSHCLMDSSGNWKSDETIMLRVYDAGTEQDTPLFSLGNQAENPHKDISIFPGNDDAGFRVSDSGSQYIGSIRLQKI